MNSNPVGRQRMSPTPPDSDWTDNSGPQVPLPPIPREASAAQPFNKPHITFSSSKDGLKYKSEIAVLHEERSSKVRVSDYTLQQVEVKLYNAEVEDAMKSERLQHSQDHLDQTVQILHGQVLFCQSLHLKAQAISRLTKLAGGFARDDHNLAIKLVDELREVQSEALTAAEALDQLYQLIDEFRDKRRDYKTATKTFSLYLRTTSQILQSQLNNFENEYDLIESNYYHIRQKLESKLPKLINEKQNVAANCFYKLVPVQEKLLEHEKQFLKLAKRFSDASRNLHPKSKFSDWVFS